MIIILDLDDTLLNSNGELSETNKKTLEKVKNNQNNLIVISTFRSLIRCKNFSEELNADFTSCFLGNLVINKHGNIIQNNCLNINDYSKLIAEYKQIFDGWVGCETDTKSIICHQETASKYDGVEFLEEDKLLEILNKGNVFKIAFQCKNDENIINQLKSLAEKYGCEHKFSKGYRYCDFIPKNSKKINFVKTLKHMFPNEKLIVFGDDKTDLESIEFADIGVAMGNSQDEIKQKATIVAPTNNEDGVAVVLEQILNK